MEIGIIWFKTLCMICMAINKLLKDNKISQNKNETFICCGIKRQNIRKDFIEN